MEADAKAKDKFIYILCRIKGVVFNHGRNSSGVLIPIRKCLEDSSWFVLIVNANNSGKSVASNFIFIAIVFLHWSPTGSLTLIRQ